MRTALAATCILTLLAVLYLSASLLILQPPRANYAGWFATASIVAAVSVLTLTVLTAVPPSPAARYAVLLGGGVAAALGAWTVRQALTSAHFEGYALVLGWMLVVQGVLTLAAFAKPRGVGVDVG